MPSWQNRAVEVALRLRGSKRTWSDPSRVRRQQRASTLRPDRYGPPRGLERRVDVSVERVEGWPVYTLRPRGQADVRWHVLYFHGGGYVAEVTPHHWRLLAELAARVPAACVLPVYPLAPTTAATTVPAAARLLRRLVDAHGSRDVVVMGDSAGGGIALAAAQALRDDTGAQPGRIVLISPWLDVTMTDPAQAALERVDPWLARPGLAEAGRLYAGDLDVRDPRVSPLFGDLTGLAPVTVFCGTRDVLLADTDALTRRAAQAGLPLDRHDGPGLFHVYPLLPTPEGRAARTALVHACRG